MSSPFPILIGRLTLVDVLVVMATVIIVPLGLRLIPVTGHYARQVLALARLIQPIGAIAVVISFLMDSGWAAGAVALLWLATCGVASVAGLIELLEVRSLRPRHLVPAAASAFLSVGAGWLVLSRAGVRPLGFSNEIVELTAVHFHYAGFAATVMASLAILVLRDHGRLARVASTAGVLMILGTPITAAGFTTGSGFLTVGGPILLATGVLTIAGLTAFVLAPSVQPRTARWLLWVSAFGVVLPMLLGVDYAVARIVPIPSLDLRMMAVIHGDLNAVVFSLAGLAGWSLATFDRGLVAEPASLTG